MGGAAQSSTALRAVVGAFSSAVRRDISVVMQPLEQQAPSGAAYSAVSLPKMSLLTELGDFGRSLATNMSRPTALIPLGFLAPLSFDIAGAVKLRESSGRAGGFPIGLMRNPSEQWIHWLILRAKARPGKMLSSVNGPSRLIPRAVVGPSGLMPRAGSTGT